MGFVLRVHFFEERNSIKRIPYAKFDRLFSKDAMEHFPTYAGKKVRCAMTMVELKHRKPVRIVHSDFMIISFTSDGTRDLKEFGRGASLAVNTIDLGLGQQDNVLNLVPRLSQKRYQEDFTWTPTDEEIELLVGDVFS